jgi:fumarate hydratase subunit alpha
VQYHSAVFVYSVLYEKERQAMQRTVSTGQIRRMVARLCVDANRHLPCSLERKISEAAQRETHPLAKSILNDLQDNLHAADAMRIPVCQDTGMAVVFLEIGQEVRLTGAPLEDAVHQGVRDGYTKGLLRCSVVEDPLRRKNTGDNTPAVIHTRIVSGDLVRITVAPKGFGSENMSSVRMFLPSDTREDIIAHIVHTVKQAGGNPCPPMVIGVGIGGDFELSAILAKKALCRDVCRRHADPYYARMEQDCLAAVNATGIGPQGFGGQTTALAVNIETYPTHIAGLPVAINIGCHVTRHKSAVL